MVPRFWNSNSYLSCAVFLQVVVLNVGHYEEFPCRNKTVGNHGQFLSLLLLSMETSAVSSDFRGLIWRMWLQICSQNLKFRCERSLVNCCGDIWHFVFSFQCWLCFGGIKYYRSHRSQNSILSHKIIFLAFTVLFTSKWLHTCLAQWCI